MPASTANGRHLASYPSTVKPEMSTLSGCVGVPTIAMMSPRPLRRSDAPGSRMLPPATDEAFGVMVTRSAPAPLSVSVLVIVSALVPGVPGPSA